jgi:hypothetical protein
VKEGFACRYYRHSVSTVGFYHVRGVFHSVMLTHLFMPCRVAARELGRRPDVDAIVCAVAWEQTCEVVAVL